MKNIIRYKIAIAILSLIVILQSLFILTRPKRAALRIPVAVKGKIAIVIDDWGYSLNNVQLLEELRYPITCSILPGLNYSESVAREAQTKGYEVILHLPMEPYEKYRLERRTIMTSLDEKSIKGIIKQDLDSLVYAKGVSNHMGSRATEDSRTMEIIFQELKKRHLYFLDSMSSVKSICFALARKMNLGFAKRDVFLDNEEEPGYIRGQIYKLKTKAKVYGRAIGIGHDRRITLEVLKEMMPELEKEGYKFVFVSELVK